MLKVLFAIVILISGLLFYTSVSIIKATSQSSLSLASFRTSIIECSVGPGISNALGSAEEIFTNDNLSPAGRLINGVLYLDLEVRTGYWYPESHEGVPIKVHAFAEAGKPLQLPGPMIRIPEGTEIRATVRNLILDSPLVLHGFFTRPIDQNDSITIPYGQTYKVNFKAGSRGTYLYRATAGNKKWDGLPYYTDSQLYGAFIIDSSNHKSDLNERIFMIGIWNDTLSGTNLMSNEELVLNGLSWPYTERLTYRQNIPVHWRVINASNQSHPMHLHGFYFTLNSKGDINKDLIYEDENRRRAVTELIHPHETMTMTWVPEKNGNWLFHCHTLVHIMPFSFLRTMPGMNEQQMNDVTTHAHSGMGGLIMGIHVVGSEDEIKMNGKRSERQLTLIAREQHYKSGKLPRKGFILVDENMSSSKEISIPGPPIILTRNERVAIKIINTLKEPTTVHWHGLEIESYFDGAAGWGNNNKKLAPLILPGASFIAHLIPPRAGTFIYHTHMHDEQLVEGMYGPLIVMEPRDTFDQATDKIFLMSSSPPLEPPVAMLNGSLQPDTMQLKVGVSYRFRLINITALNPDLRVSLLFKGKPVNWLAIAKDGAYLPKHQMVMMSADAQGITIGETRDFNFQPIESGSYSFELRDGVGMRLFTSMVIQAK